MGGAKERPDMLNKIDQDIAARTLICLWEHGMRRRIRSLGFSSGKVCSGDHVAEKGQLNCFGISQVEESKQ